MTARRNSAAGTAVDLLRTGVITATLFAAWLALTLAFMVGGVAVVGSGVTAIGQTHAFASVLVTVLGVLAVSALSPTVAGYVVVVAMERVQGVVDRSGSVLAVLRDVVPCEFGDGGCATSAACCC